MKLARRYKCSCPRPCRRPCSCRCNSRCPCRCRCGRRLAVVDDGFGFLRGERLLPGPNDIYVSQGLVKRHGLRNGDSVSGQVRQPRGGDKYYGLMSVTDVNHMDPQKAALRPDFDALTAIFPDDMFHLESGAGEISQRMIDLFSPVGKGQRGLIVSPPKAGKRV